MCSTGCEMDHLQAAASPGTSLGRLRGILVLERLDISSGTGHLNIDPLSLVLCSASCSRSESWPQAGTPPACPPNSKFPHLTPYQETCPG